MGYLPLASQTAAVVTHSLGTLHLTVFPILNI